MEWNNEWKNLLATLMQVVIIPAIPITVAFVVKLCRAKSDEALAKISSDAARRALDEASNAVVQAVEYTSQTYVDALKSRGNFGSKEQEAAFKKAKEAALQILTKESQAILGSIIEDIEAWIATKIEQTVREKKYLCLPEVISEFSTEITREITD